MAEPDGARPGRSIRPAGPSICIANVLGDPRRSPELRHGDGRHRQRGRPLPVSAPINGDYDIVGILCGCAIFAFLPYCQLHARQCHRRLFHPRRAATGQGRARRHGNAALSRRRHRCSPGGSSTALLEMRQSSEQIAAFAFYRWWTIPFDLFCMIVLIFAILYTLPGRCRRTRRSHCRARRPRGGRRATHERSGHWRLRLRGRFSR